MLMIAGKPVEKSEADRVRAALAEVARRAGLPPEAGDNIAPAPARGGFVLGPVDRSDPSPDYARTASGHARVRPIRCADVFDLMAAQAARRKVAHPLSQGQIEVARRYRGLVEVLSADGCKLSSLDRTPAGEAPMDWMDRRLMISAEVEMLRERMGNAAALVVRRQRKGVAVGARRTIRTRSLVDAVCLHDRTLDKVLRRHGWQADGRNRDALLQALSGALWRMVGYRGEK